MLFLFPPKLNLIDKQFTRLKVIEEVGRDPHGGVLWRCQCKCGNMITVAAVRLQSGNVKSCGCLKRDAAKAKQHMATDAVIRDGMNLNVLSSVTRSNTGVRGVSYNLNHKNYEAKLVLRGKTVFRGVYHTLQEAVEARKEAEKTFLQPLKDKLGLM